MIEFHLIPISTRERLELCPQFFNVGGPVCLPRVSVESRFRAATFYFDSYVVVIRHRDLVRDPPARNRIPHVSRSQGDVNDIFPITILESRLTASVQEVKVGGGDELQDLLSPVVRVRAAPRQMVCVSIAPQQQIPPLILTEFNYFYDLRRRAEVRFVGEVGFIVFVPKLHS